MRTFYIIWSIIVIIGFIWFTIKVWFPAMREVGSLEDDEVYYGPKGGRYRYSKNKRTKIYF